MTTSRPSTLTRRQRTKETKEQPERSSSVSVRRGTGERSVRKRQSQPRSKKRTTAPANRAAESSRLGRLRRGRARRRTKRLPVTDFGERNAAFLATTVVGLTLFGLVMVLSASSVTSLHELEQSPFFQFKRQGVWAVLGLVAFVAMSRFDYRKIRGWAKPMYLGVTVLLVLLLVPGVGRTVNGSTRWLALGPLVIQPSELAKLALIVLVADLLAQRERRMHHPELTIRPTMLLLGVMALLIVMQPKLGTPLIMGAVTILMLFIAGADTKSLGMWCASAMALATVAAVSKPYRMARLLSFMDPWADPEGNGFQAVQAQVGISSGGLLGAGLGASRAKWGFLPFAHTDFIYAIVAEEVGLLGAGAVIGAFLLIGWFGFKAAIHAPDRFGTLLAAGITSWILVQAFMNIGMVLSVLPITGEALPFVSAGGSSLVVVLAAAGLLTAVSRRAVT